MKYLYQIKLSQYYNSYSYCIFADGITKHNHAIANSIEFFIKDEFVTSIILDNEIEYIKQFDIYGELIQTIYQKENKEND